MKAFSIERFMNVAKWDLMVNRPFYMRVVMAIASCVFVPLMVRYLIGWGMDILSSSSVRNVNDDVSMVVMFIQGLYPFMMTILMGYMFHNLLTRQGRINEFTLPATNLERFLWHVALIVLGGNLVLFVSLILADIFHVVLSYMGGVRFFESITFSIFEFNTSLYEDILRVMDLSNRSALIYLLIALLITCCKVTFFALVNAWKYRYNIPLAYVLQAAIGTVFSTLFAGIVVWNVKTMGNVTMRSLLILDSVNWQFYAVLFISALLLLLAAMWWLTYRLYCKAQITTKRNP